MEYANGFAKTTLSLQKKSEQLEQVQKDVEASRKAVEASLKDIEALKKAHEEELKKVKAQAAAEQAKKDEDKKKIVDALVYERDVLKKTLNLVPDPTNPRNVRRQIQAMIQKDREDVQQKLMELFKSFMETAEALNKIADEAFNELANLIPQ
eukprot:jgi/Phyca11/512019/fgenesh2_kg.PHYCAscaffold_116_\